MRLGVVGCGIVGTALIEALTQKKHDVYDCDIAYPSYSLKELVDKCETIFICVPTPENVSIVEQVVSEISLLNYGGLVIIKSTVSPTTTQRLQKQYGDMRFAYNPEFLRQEHALEDMLNPDRIVLGAFCQEDMDVLCKIYEAWDCPKILCTPTEAELIKYASNMFLVAKVAYGLEIGRLAKKYGCAPRKTLLGVGLDNRIKRSHLDPTKGKIPMNTPCLAKDMQAFLKFLENNGEKSELLEQIWKNGVESNERIGSIGE